MPTFAQRPCAERSQSEPPGRWRGGTALARVPAQNEANGSRAPRRLTPARNEANGGGMAECRSHWRGLDLHLWRSCRRAAGAGTKPIPMGRAKSCGLQSGDWDRPRWCPTTARRAGAERSHVGRTRSNAWTTRVAGYSADAAGGVSDRVSAVVVAGAGLASLPLPKLGTTDVAARAARLSSAGSGGVLDLWPK